MGLPLYVGLWTALGLGGRRDRRSPSSIRRPRSALLLRASREDEAAAAASGVHIVRHRLIAFVISGFLSGIAGVLLAHFLGTVRVETFYLDLTFLIVAMLVIGGMRSLTGAVLGALVIAALTELLRQVEIGVSVGGTTIAAPPGLGDAILALLMLLIILFRPKGIAGGKEIAWPFGADEDASGSEARSNSGWRNRSTPAHPSRDAPRGSSGQARRRSRRRPCRPCAPPRRACRDRPCSRGRREDLRAADVAVAGHDDLRLPALELAQDGRPARRVEVGVVRREPGKDRKDPLLGEIAGEEDALRRQPDDLVAARMREAQGAQLDLAPAEIESPSTRRHRRRPA